MRLRRIFLLGACSLILKAQTSTDQSKALTDAIASLQSTVQ